MMKTAVTVLQEMMVKMGQVPDYQFIAQSGLQHMATFEYQCSAQGVTARATARSKKEAKQEVARRLLLQLSQRGHSVPPPYAAPALAHPAAGDSPPPDRSLPGGAGAGEEPGAGAGAGAGAAGGGVPEARSHVALLKELCEQYRLGGVEYTLVGDTGPPHARHFTVRATLGRHERHATATTKKLARQRAAEILYAYLRENLHRLTHDFVEEDALVRAHEKAMDRYVEVKEDGVVKPNLGQKISEYHLGVLTDVDEEARASGLQALQATERRPAADALAAVAAALGLTVQADLLPESVGVISLRPTAPPLTFAGADLDAAAAAALRYLRRALPHAAPLAPLAPGRA